jgi:hypothetical protein
MVPMFPLGLAEGPFSLNEGGSCGAMSVSAVLGQDGALEDFSVQPSRVVVSHKMTFDQVGGLREGGWIREGVGVVEWGVGGGVGGGGKRGRGVQRMGWCAVSSRVAVCGLLLIPAYGWGWGEGTGAVRAGG